MTIERRPATPDDDSFLYRLMQERVRQELPLDHLPAPLQEQIREMQVKLRAGVFRRHYGSQGSQMILVDGEAAGWLLVEGRAASIHLVEIGVLGKYRRQGIGTACIRETIAAAERAGKPVTLRVNVTNGKAIHVYESLGFVRTGGDEVQHEMERPLSKGAQNYSLSRSRKHPHPA